MAENIEELLKILVAQLKAAPNYDYINIKNEVTKMGQFTLDKLLSELINMNIDNQENIEYLIEHLKPFIKIRNFVIHRLHFLFIDSTRAEFLIQSFFTLESKIKTKIKSITDNMVFLDTMDNNNYIYKALYAICEQEYTALYEDIVRIISKK